MQWLALVLGEQRRRYAKAELCRRYPRTAEKGAMYVPNETITVGQMATLLAAARCGDAHAREQIGRLVLQAARPIATHIAARFGLCQDDLIGEAALVLWESVMSGFDPQRGTLKGYAQARVRWLGVDLVRRRNAIRRGGGGWSERYAEAPPRDGSGVFRRVPANEHTPEAIVGATESLREAIGDSRTTGWVVRRRMEGLTSRQIAAELERHPAQITRCLHALRAKLA